MNYEGKINASSALNNHKDGTKQHLRFAVLLKFRETLCTAVFKDISLLLRYVIAFYHLLGLTSLQRAY